MSTHSNDTDFERWLEDRLDTHLGVHAGGAAPGNARYRSQARRRFAVAPVQVTLAVGAALLAIGGGAAYASGLVHGTSVSQAAHSCPTSPNDAHGDCVATVAHSTSTSATSTSTTSTSSTHSNNDTHGDLVSNAAHTCPTSPSGAHGQCVSNVASGGKSGGKSNTAGGAPPGNSRH